MKDPVKEALKRHGANAAAHFGYTERKLASYMKTGRYPWKLMNQVFAEGEGQFAPQAPQEVAREVPLPPKPEPELVPMPPPEQEPESIAAGVMGGTLNTSDDVIRQMLDPNADSIKYLLEREREMTHYLQRTVDFYIKQFASRVALLERTVAALSAQQLRLSGVASQTRPDAGVPVDQVYTTSPSGAPFDTGRAPTKEQVDAQASMPIIEGVPIPGARPAAPAYGDSSAPPFGYGWNKPRPPPPHR